MFNSEYMDPDGETKNKSTERKENKASFSKGLFANASTILQPVWVRCCTIFSDICDRRFMESQLRNVLYCGVFFWSLLIFYTIIK